MGKKTISMIMVLVMLIALLPPIATPVSANTITVRTATLDLTSMSTTTNASEGWYWDDPSKTLTLAGANFIIAASSFLQYGIKLPAGATIVLEEGTTSSINFNISFVARTQSYGIYVETGDLTIQGSGELVVNGGNVLNDLYSGGDHYSAGIYVEGNLIIDSGTVTATGGSIQMPNLDHYLATSNSFGIYTKGSITIETGTVTATGGTITLPELRLSHTGKSFGIYSQSETGSITMNDAIVTAKGNEVTANGVRADWLELSYLIVKSAGIYSENAVNINGGMVSTESSEVDAAASVSDENTYGLYASGPLNIVDGTVTAQGGFSNSLTVESPSYAIYANDVLTLSGGYVTAIGADTRFAAHSDSYGIYAEKAFTVLDGNLNVIGGRSLRNSYAVYANDVFTVTHGSVTAIGASIYGGVGFTVSNYVIYVNEDIDISGGTVLVKAGEVLSGNASPNSTPPEFSYGMFAHGAIDFSGGVIVSQSGAIAETSMAINKEPHVSNMERLIGASDELYVVYGPSAHYYVIDLAHDNVFNDMIGLDPTTIPSDAGDHIHWDETAQTLTLYNVIVNVETPGNHEEDSYGIHGDISNIVYKGLNFVRSGNTIGEAKNSYGIYSSSDLTIEQVADTTSMLITIGGTADTGTDGINTSGTSSGIYVDGNLHISGSTIKAIGGIGRHSTGVYTTWPDFSSPYDTTIDDSAFITIGDTAYQASYGITTGILTIHNGSTLAVSRAGHTNSRAISESIEVNIEGGHGVATRQSYSHRFTTTDSQKIVLGNPDVLDASLVWGKATPLPTQTLMFTSVMDGAVAKTYGDPNFTLTASRAEADGGAIAYTSSDETVATVDSQTGEITMYKAGYTTITATAAMVPETYRIARETYVLTVNPKPLTWNHDGTAHNKIYNGNTHTTVDQLPTLSGIINGDAVTVRTGNVAFADRFAGTDKPINAGGWGIEGADTSNYTAPTDQPTFAAANIAKLQLTATATATNRIYDGTTAVRVNITPTNKYGPDQITLTGTGKMADANPGTNKPVTISGIQLSGSAAGNYIAPVSVETTVNITKSHTGFTAISPVEILINSEDTSDHTLELLTTLSPTGAADPGAVTFALESLTNLDSILDGDPTLNGTTLTYKGNGQTTGTATQRIRIVSDNYTDMFANIIFGTTGKEQTTVTMIPPADITFGQALGDPSASTSDTVADEQYTYSYTGVSTPGNIYAPSEAKPTNAGNYIVTATVTSDVYFGHDSAGFTISKATPIGTPTFTEISGSGKTLADTNITGPFINPFNSATVEGQLTWDDGIHMMVTQGTSYDWTFSAYNSNNYYVVTGSIIPWPDHLPSQTLTFDEITNGMVAKTYGDPTFVITATREETDGGAISYESSDETVATVDASTGEVAMRKAGQATITATAAGVPGLYGESTAAYVLTVNPKALTWNSDGTAKNKPYDGTVTATVDRLPTLSGIINDDAVTITTGDTSFADANAGTDKTIHASGWGIEGADASNYAVPTAQPIFGSADITKRQLIATATATDRAYDGTTAVTVALTPTNKVGADQVSLTATGTIEDASVGTNKPVTISDIQLSGDAAGNYLVPVSVETTVNITKAKAIDMDTGAHPFTATTPIMIYIHSSNTNANTLELPATLNPTGTHDPGTITFTLDALTNSDSILDGNPTLNGTTLTYKGNGKPIGIATQIIRIKSDNYEDIFADIIFEATDKEQTTVTVTPPANMTYGQTLGDPSASTSDTVADELYTYTYSGTLTSGTPYGPSETKPTNAGSYTVLATLNSAQYHGSDSASFTIIKATPTGTPTYAEISGSGKTLADAKIAGDFTNPNNSDAVEGQLTWDDGDSAAVTQGTSYDWTFTPNDTHNYNVVTGSIIPWLAPPGGEISGTLSIAGTPHYGYVLTGNVNLSGDPWGNLTYTWKRGTTVLQMTTKTEDIDRYTVQSGDIGSTITLEVTSDYYSGKLAASTDVAVTKRSIKEPSPPIVASVTKISITLRAAAGYEYTIDNGNTWQDSPVFTDLTPSTTYTFKQRIKETPTSFASETSGAAFGTTLDIDRLEQPENLHWDTTGTEVIAKWDDVPNHSGFTVQLYKDGVPVGQPIRINETSYDFSAAIWAAGDGIYTFTVLAKGDNVNYIDSLKSRVSTAYVKKETRNVSGIVEDENQNSVNGAEVRVMQGNIQIGVTVMTALDGTFTITGIPSGSYNLVITKGDQRVTRYFTVGDTDYIFEQVITLPSGKKNSVLEIAHDTPDIVVDKLDDMFNQPEIYTPEDAVTVANGGKVEIKLAVEKNDNAANVSEISNAASSSGFIMGTVLDLNVTKTATDSMGTVTAFTPITDTQVLLTIVIPIPVHEQGKSEYRLIRAHDYEDGNGVVTEYISTTANANGERIEVNADMSIITAYVRFFSTYVIVYPDGSQTGDGSDDGSSDGSGGSSSDSSNESSSEPEANTIVIVDGVDKYIGKEVIEGNTTKSIPDQEMLEAEIKNASESVVVPISANKEVSAQLVVKNVEEMKARGITLTVQTGKISYNIDTTAINIDEIRTVLGEDVDTSEMPFIVTIKDVGDEVTVPGIAEENVIVTPISFTMRAAYNGKVYNIEKLDSFINRTIEITKEQADRITTAVVVEPNRTLRHVPTEVYTIDGKYYAKINTLTNSVYTLINNDLKFDDAIGKWYQEQADEMTSRKVLYGVSEGVFDGDRNITRAEFAAMIVRALGLPANDISTFSDVTEDVWYSGAVATAADYGIVVGIGDNQFAPLANITRQEAMAILYRTAKLTPYVDQGIDSDVISTFSDYGIQSDWANSAIEFNLSNNFIVGYDDGTIRPKDYITRSEAATVILRLLQKAQLVDVRSHP